MDLKAIAGLLRDTYSAWDEHKAPQLGAALAYYTLFSLAPLLLIIIAVAGLVFGERAARGEVVGQIGSVVGPDSARLIQSMLDSVRNPSSNIAQTLVGAVFLLLGALGIVGQIKSALNTMWGVETRAGRGLIGAVRQHVYANAVSLFVVLAAGLLLLILLLAGGILAAIASFWSDSLPQLAGILPVANLLLLFGVGTLLFAMIYKVLPDCEIPWSDVWIGASATALLFGIGEMALAPYLAFSNLGLAFGAAGSLVVVLVWIYYSAQILLFGAEFTQVYARKFGSRANAATQRIGAQGAAEPRGRGTRR